jgi:hypothetical protein
MDGLTTFGFSEISTCARFDLSPGDWYRSEHGDLGLACSPPSYVAEGSEYRAFVELTDEDASLLLLTKEDFGRVLRLPKARVQLQVGPFSDLLRKMYLKPKWIGVSAAGCVLTVRDSSNRRNIWYCRLDTGELVAPDKFENAAQLPWADKWAIGLRDAGGGPLSPLFSTGA